MRTIDLTRYTADGKVRNLSGKDRGLDARAQFRMDEEDRQTDPVTVYVPDYVYAISTSFFCGMFGASYNVLRRDGLLRKYRFEVPDVLRPQIDQGLERCSYDFDPLTINVANKKSKVM